MGRTFTPRTLLQGDRANPETHTVCRGNLNVMAKTGLLSGPLEHVLRHVATGFTMQIRTEQIAGSVICSEYASLLPRPEQNPHAKAHKHTHGSVECSRQQSGQHACWGDNLEGLALHVCHTDPGTQLGGLEQLRLGSDGWVFLLSFFFQPTTFQLEDSYSTC